VALADALESGGLIKAAGDEHYHLTETGRRKLGELGVDLTGLNGASKGAARPCIDWTERRRHLKGPLAARLLTRFLELGWIERGKENRAIHVTPKGRQGLRNVLSVDLDMASAA
jgi:predicted transcriptional regulator